MIRWSTETTSTPRAAACATTALSALALDGLMMIAFAPAEIRLRMSAICSAGPPLRLATMTLQTLPLASACALTAQIISSRQPLPTSVLLTPRTYFPVAAGFALAVLAAPMTAMATTATSATAERRGARESFLKLHAIPSLLETPARVYDDRALRREQTPR